ncbi:hypothetical protein HMPREF3282_03085 [Staphylococcus sp. HMSC73C01]|nr:hypothetical protein AL501_11685 [Staphylococcus lugdunensis]OFK10637.1 hypothetical protein HMPREF2831_01980 [Staphylococcus sp. HMSC065E07]OHP75236.1 hypothetical protein HMPREF2585_05405 [Staphylococcus sp. HMSC062D12]OHP87595.1 hypothetical protein HMPREF2529_05310 [Staphylococcus sp. HMSC063D03]OHP89428.1 hypothetical protein HMPREF2538_02200 [Staphylococcus sp. HMSC063E12]OHS18233.1 hypothetical protein HMPREF3255_03835 [Staphylococcus sp. HMSC55D02]OHS37671.1 hypothetical protein HM
MNNSKDYLKCYKKNNIYKDNYVLFGTFFKAYSESTILRHSHASMLVNHGACIMIIAQRLGHADCYEVYNRYGHLYPSTQKEIIKYLWRLNYDNV